MRRNAGIRAEEGDRDAVTEHGRLRLDSSAAGQLLQGAIGRAQPPQMASVDVANVGGIDDAAAVGARGSVFDLEPSRRQQPRFAMFTTVALLCWVFAAGLKLTLPYFQRLP